LGDFYDEVVMSEKYSPEADIDFNNTSTCEEPRTKKKRPDDAKTRRSSAVLGITDEGREGDIRKPNAKRCVSEFITNREKIGSVMAAGGVHSDLKRGILW